MTAVTTRAAMYIIFANMGHSLVCTKLVYFESNAEKTTLAIWLADGNTTSLARSHPIQSHPPRNRNGDFCANNRQCVSRAWYMDRDDYLSEKIPFWSKKNEKLGLIHGNIPCWSYGHAHRIACFKEKSPGGSVHLFFVDSFSFQTKLKNT